MRATLALNGLNNGVNLQNAHRTIEFFTILKGTAFLNGVI